MTTPAPTRVSVVLPAYDEGGRLPALTRDLVAHLAAVRDVAVELLVVDDGSAASESAIMRTAVVEAEARLRESAAAHTFRFERAPRNGGKGSAIRLGWHHADPRADWLGWVDADGAVSAAELVRLIGITESARGVDAVAGARVKMAGKQVHRRAFRHAQGRIFATITETCLGLGVYDTQCGVKLMRADRVRPLLPLLRENGWMLDVEILALLKAGGARFLEVPIDWTDAGTSKVRFGIDPLRMLWALGRIRARMTAR